MITPPHPQTRAPRGYLFFFPFLPACLHQLYSILVCPSPVSSICLSIPEEPFGYSSPPYQRPGHSILGPLSPYLTANRRRRLDDRNKRNERRTASAGQHPLHTRSAPLLSLTELLSVQKVSAASDILPTCAQSRPLRTHTSTSSHTHINACRTGQRGYTHSEATLYSRRTEAGRSRAIQFESIRFISCGNFANGVTVGDEIEQKGRKRSTCTCPHDVIRLQYNTASLLTRGLASSTTYLPQLNGRLPASVSCNNGPCLSPPAVLFVAANLAASRAARSPGLPLRPSSAARAFLAVAAVTSPPDTFSLHSTRHEWCFQTRNTITHNHHKPPSPSHTTNIESLASFLLLPSTYLARLQSFASGCLPLSRLTAHPATKKKRRPAPPPPRSFPPLLSLSLQPTPIGYDDTQTTA